MHGCLSFIWFKLILKREKISSHTNQKVASRLDRPVADFGKITKVGRSAFVGRRVKLGVLKTMSANFQPSVIIILYFFKAIFLSNLLNCISFCYLESIDI